MAAISATSSATETLTADAVDTVTLGRQTTIEVIHHSDVTDPIYFRTDGVDPVSAASENEVLLPSERLTVKLGDSPIRLISAGAATYTVAMVG